MTSSGPTTGTPWPSSEHGEVVGPPPDFARSFLPALAGPLVGKSPKWAKWLLNQSRVEGYRESTGHKRVFLDAAAFEAYCEEHGLWPPPMDFDDTNWQVLAIRQERDLEELRAKIVELDDRCAQLRADLTNAKRDRDASLEMVSRLADMARALPVIE